MPRRVLSVVVSIVVLLGGMTSGALAGTVLQAAWVDTGFVIDGQIDDASWSSANRYTVSFENHVSSVLADIYLAHDGTYLYVGLDTPMGSGWDSLSHVDFDGNHDGALLGATGTPRYDIQGCQPATGAYQGYVRYWAGLQPATPPTGYQSATSFDGTEDYEYRFVLADITDSLASTVGVLFLIQEGSASKANQYTYATSDIIKYSDPNWLNPNGDVANWADLTFAAAPGSGGGSGPGGAVVPLPSASIAGLAMLGLLGALKRRRRRP